MKNFIFLISFWIISTASFAQDVRIVNDVFEVLYSQDLEQPLWIKYRSQNLPTNVNRGSMNFYKEADVHTSDDTDYKWNIWDKGHGAPAASFSNNEETL
jgi:DNA/RNA endonuclease G (NUC1)